jgi:nitrous oxide reductase
MNDLEARIDFRKLLGFRHVVTLTGAGDLGSAPAQSGETASLARAAGAIFTKGGELSTCESEGTS